MPYFPHHSKIFAALNLFDNDVHNKLLFLTTPEVAVCRTIDYVARIIKPGTVAGTIPTLLGRVP
jgi:hypothetical protein